MNDDEQPILGSAESLTPAQRRVRLRELAAWGVDLSLANIQIAKSPAECLEEWLAFHTLAEAAAHAHAEGRVYPHQLRRSTGVTN